MKSLLILPALAAGILASKVALNNHELAALLGRAIDPIIMDPTQLSVLSVLRTAMPTASDTPMPQDDFEPEWYQNLPQDVKSLLPSLYPATTTATPTDRATSVTEVVSQTPVPYAASSIGESLSLLPSSTVLVSSTLANTGTVNDTLPVTSAPTSTSIPASSSLWTSQTTVTKTLQYAPTTPTGKNSTWITASANGTLPTASPLPSPSGSFSAGAKTAVKMETLAAIVWISVGVGFFIFA
ncbi:uncharacterized protein K460DRAFT_421633 [Cucurbitaria berberidis CBS 394.84]|uniref:Uncharacterized protein n=1 Tax=Cucurbitaria berberidis CBS 394.84 TaxID=1168544 RepID=A0A9P4G6L6_9PLEO|nr:uncharacterized protein K460DRAFT_421633 [Cucurbitaria berberidis CBS 394.84]KAF1839968.1 hypothetical protein K460DRAFT_421633 [Cucurbitaria berberidis CBS 394.84]